MKINFPKEAEIEPLKTEDRLMIMNSLLNSEKLHDMKVDELLILECHEFTVYIRKLEEDQVEIETVKSGSTELLDMTKKEA